jgi:hypothetical protein
MSSQARWVSCSRLWGHRAVFTDSPLPMLAAEADHRRHAIIEQVAADLKSGRLAHLPLTAFAQNQIWIAVVQLATELTAWLQMLALTGTGARRWEPKRIRLQLFSVAGSIARRSRRVWLHLSSRVPHGHLFTAGLTRLQLLPHPT